MSSGNGCWERDVMLPSQKQQAVASDWVEDGSPVQERGKRVMVPGTSRGRRASQWVCCRPSPPFSSFPHPKRPDQSDTPKLPWAKDATK